MSTYIVQTIKQESKRTNKYVGCIIENNNAESIKEKVKLYARRNKTTDIRCKTSNYEVIENRMAKFGQNQKRELK